jgi:hypothetical protein
LSVIEFCKDGGRSCFGGWHRVARNSLDISGSHMKACNS